MVILGLEEEDESDDYNSEELEADGNSTADAALALFGLSSLHNSSCIIGSKQGGATSMGPSREFNVIASPLTSMNAVEVVSNLN